MPRYGNADGWLFSRRSTKSAYVLRALYCFAKSMVNSKKKLLILFIILKTHFFRALHAVYHLELKFVYLIVRYQNPPSEFRGENSWITFKKSVFYQLAAINTATLTTTKLIKAYHLLKAGTLLPTCCHSLRQLLHSLRKKTKNKKVPTSLKQPNCQSWRGLTGCYAYRPSTIPDIRSLQRCSNSILWNKPFW